MSHTTPEPPICDYEDSSYRTDFWEGQGREYENLAEHIALGKILPASGARLIDIGAGFGRLVDLYANYEHVILLDYSHSQLVYARQHWGDDRFTYVAADIYKLPLTDNAVDTLVMVRVMHHLANVPLALQQLARIMLPGGTCVIEYANKRHLKNVLRCVVGNGPNPFNRAPFEFAPLHYDFHPRWIYQQLANAGLETRTSLSVSLFRAGFLKRRIKPEILARLDGYQQRLLAPLAISPSIFTVNRKRGAATTKIAPLSNLFICPDCRSDNLVKTPAALHCAVCGHDWPIIDGVYVFK